MNNRIKILFVLIGAFLIFGKTVPVHAATSVSLYLFYGEGCPHCAKEEVFLNNLQALDGALVVKKFEVWSNKDNAELLGKVAKKLKITSSGVPVTVIGGRALIGFDRDDTTGQAIRAMIDDARTVGDYEDVVGRLISGDRTVTETEKIPAADAIPQSDTIKSLFGEFNIRSLSLPALTALIGSLDSLNPCAMWVLLFLISLLFGMENRGKMWLLGGTFIFASAAAYFIFLAAWLNIYIFIGYISWLKLAIALFATGSGIYYLKKYWVDRKGGCKIEDSDKRKKIIERLKEIASDRRLVFAVLGIAALGASINMVELLCSAGLPAIYVPILTMSGLATWQYYAYLTLYVFFYILPQLVTFLIAMFSLRVTAISSRVTKYSNLVGGLLMLAMGLILLFRPGWLAFG